MMYKIKLKNVFKHLKTVTKHRYYVCKYCFKFGLYWQGLTHDLSKFGPTEFWSSVKYYQGTRSPIDAEKEDKGYSMAWLHHKSKNKHHFWYWVDYSNGQVQTPVRIPIKYVYEMIADTVAAGYVYSKNANKKWKQSDPYEYYKAHNRNAANNVEFIEFCTKAVLDNIYVDISRYGIDTVAKLVRENYYSKFYNNKKDKDGNEILDWLAEYNKLVNKYYKED